GPLILASDGKLYGTAMGGGAYGYGTVFRSELSGATTVLYSFGAPDVSPPTVTSFTPTSGIINTKVTINGTGFTGVSAVKFNGTAAPFTVLSSTQLTARVSGGTSPGKGKITVTTQAGTATSATDFIYVVP